MRPHAAIRVLAVFASTALIGFLIWVSVDAWLAGRENESWPAVPCTILESRVESTGPGDGAAVFSIAVRYEYEVDGSTHVGDTYAAASSLEEDEAERIVAELRPDTRTTCYVDPDDPTRAVLARGGDDAVLFFWLFVLVLFVVLPAAGMGCVWALDRLRARKRR